MEKLKIIRRVYFLLIGIRKPCGIVNNEMRGVALWKPTSPVGGRDTLTDSLQGP